MTLLVFVGVLGLIVIVMLMGAWRRHLKRQQRRDTRGGATDSPDIWQISGQRLPDDDGDDAQAAG